MKRSHVAVFAFVLVLAGCGGDGKEKDASAQASSPAASAPPNAPSVPSGSDGSAATSGRSPAPQPTGTGPQARAAKKFNDCMRRQGVAVPSPHMSRTPSPAELEKIKRALRTCMTAMSPAPQG